MTNNPNKEQGIKMNYYSKTSIPVALIYLSLFSEGQREELVSYVMRNGRATLNETKDFQTNSPYSPMSILGLADDDIIGDPQDKIAFYLTLAMMVIKSIKTFLTKDSMKEILEMAVGIKGSQYVNSIIDNIITPDDTGEADLGALEHISLALSNVGNFIAPGTPFQFNSKANPDAIPEMVEFGHLLMNQKDRKKMMKGSASILNSIAATGDPLEDDLDALESMLENAGSLMSGNHPVQALNSREQGSIGALIAGASGLLRSPAVQSALRKSKERLVQRFKNRKRAGAPMTRRATVASNKSGRGHLAVPTIKTPAVPLNNPSVAEEQTPTAYIPMPPGSKTKAVIESGDPNSMDLSIMLDNPSAVTNDDLDRELGLKMSTAKMDQDGDLFEVLNPFKNLTGPNDLEYISSSNE